MGRYQLLVPLARGGMAEVWIARLLGELGFSRIFALKTIRSEFAGNSSFREFFFEEARIAARLRHVNVVEVVDLGEEGPILFQVMTLIEGDSLANILRTNVGRVSREAPSGLPDTIATRIVCDMLAGLHAAHELTNDDGIKLELVHRDVSPQNVLVGVDGVAKLSDFGIAQVLGGVMEDRSGVVGKPGYVSPEQAERRPLDRRSDIFTSGIILWEALTGRRLFQTSSPGVVAVTSLGGEVPDPRDFAPGLGPAIADVAMRALSTSPAARFQTAAEMRDALEAAARASGSLATATDVARLVSDLSGQHIADIQQAVRVALRGEGGDDPLRERATELMTLSAIRLDATGAPARREDLDPTSPPARELGILKSQRLTVLLVVALLATLALVIQIRSGDPEVSESEPTIAEAGHGAHAPTDSAPDPERAVGPENIVPPPSTGAPSRDTLLAPDAEATPKPTEEPPHAKRPTPSPPKRAPERTRAQTAPALPSNAKKARVVKPTPPPRPKFTNPYAR